MPVAADTGPRPQRKHPRAAVLLVLLVLLPLLLPAAFLTWLHYHGGVIVGKHGVWGVYMSPARFIMSHFPQGYSAYPRQLPSGDRLIDYRLRIGDRGYMIQWRENGAQVVRRERDPRMRNE